MKLEYNCGGLFKNILIWIVQVIIAMSSIIGCVLYIPMMDENSSAHTWLSLHGFENSTEEINALLGVPLILLIIVGVSTAIGALLYPAVTFWTLGDEEVKELKNYNKDKDEKEHIKIPHPKRAIIATLTIIGFFTGGIGHLIALFFGCGQGLVEISESQRKLLSLAEGVNTQEQKSSIAIGGIDVATVTSTGNATTNPSLPAQDKQNTVELEDSLKNLRELKSLLDDGVIDQETYDKKKKEIGF